MKSYAGFLAYRLKMQPLDFQVQEIAELPLKSESAGRFSVYELEKTGWNTADVISRIAKESKLPAKAFNYGGKKDRHAYTRQWITVESPRDLSQKTEGYSLRKIGYSDEPMLPEHIRGNRFSLTVRNILEREGPQVEAGFERLQRTGFPNYFDDQRFGAFHPVVGFAFLSLFRGDPESALRYSLLSPFGGEKPHAKKRKKAIHDVWGDWKRCLDLAVTKPETAILGELKRRKLVSGDRSHEAAEAFLELLDRLPREDLSMAFSAFQSWIFNEALARLLRYLDRGTPDLWRGGATHSGEGSAPRMNQGTAMGSAGENAAGDEIGKREISRHFLQAVEIKTKTGDQCFPVSLAGPLIEQLKDCSPELVGPGNRDLSSFFRNESDRTQSEAGIGRSHPAPPSQAPLLLEELFQRGFHGYSGAQTNGVKRR